MKVINDKTYKKVGLFVQGRDLETNDNCKCAIYMIDEHNNSSA